MDDFGKFVWVRFTDRSFKCGIIGAACLDQHGYLGIVDDLTLPFVYRGTGREDIDAGGKLGADQMLRQLFCALLVRKIGQDQNGSGGFI